MSTTARSALPASASNGATASGKSPCGKAPAIPDDRRRYAPADLSRDLYLILEGFVPDQGIHYRPAGRVITPTTASVHQWNHRSGFSPPANS